MLFTMYICVKLGVLIIVIQFSVIVFCKRNFMAIPQQIFISIYPQSKTINLNQIKNPRTQNIVLWVYGLKI